MLSGGRFSAGDYLQSDPMGSSEALITLQSESALRQRGQAFASVIGCIHQSLTVGCPMEGAGWVAYNFLDEEVPKNL